jgi:2,3-bisphosphoglycerate-dependent phosphoglycerate mutase
MLWRRSYDAPPPPIADDDPLSQFTDPRYAGLPPELVPGHQPVAGHPQPRAR